MKDLESQINQALHAGKTIPRESVVRWIDYAGNDLRVLSKLYKLTSECYYQIQPELGGEGTCALIQHYLLECIRQNVMDDEQIEERWEAARTLHGWFCHLAQMDDTSTILKRAVDAVTDAFLNGDDGVRVAIEQGFLEHALEMEALWPFFEHWSSDTHLEPAWSRAMEWGKAHPNYTWSLLQRLRERDK